MAGYTFVAIDSRGKEKRGKMEAPDRERVYLMLTKQGLIPITIKEQTLFNRDINIEIGNPVNTRVLCIFLRQFVSMLSAGVSIYNALELLVEETENKHLNQGLTETKALVEKGERLTDAMRNQGKIFPSMLIHMVDAGETSGNLEQALERMADHYEKDSKIKALVRKAMIYPLTIAVVAVAVITLMLVVVIPNFMKMFADMSMELPAITMRVIAISNFVRDKWYLLFGIVVMLAIGLTIFKRLKKGKYLWANFLLRLPLFGKIQRKSICARLCRTLGTLLRSGIPLFDALDISAKAFENQQIKRILQETKEEVARGVPLSAPLQASGFFPPMVYHMVKIGEESGDLVKILDTMADYYDDEVEIAAGNLTALIEPLIIIIMALLVGILVLAIMQPMMSMYNQMDMIIK